MLCHQGAVECTQTRPLAANVMSDAPDIVYKQLHGSEIRIVEILPGRWDDTVSCRLEHVRLRGVNDPQYVALSYAWGDAMDTVDIMLNGIVHPVTRNLFTALRRLRHSSIEACLQDGASEQSHGPINGALVDGSNTVEAAQGSPSLSPSLQLKLSRLRFWVDALCINQADTQEKARQIPRMREIYGYTMQVLAWLGENPIEDDSSLIRATDYHSRRAVSGLNGGFYGNKLRLHLLREEGCVQAVERLLQRPWFTRVWVIQEVTLPQREVVLVAGRHQYSLDHMDKLYWAVDYDHSLPHPVIGATRLYRQLNDEEHWERPALAMAKSERVDPRATAFSIRFAKVQASLKTLVASIKHDYLYAILGLCSSVPDTLIPDYRKPFPVVYREYARFLFGSTGDLAALIRKGRDLDQSVPSWVPDFASASLLSAHHLSLDGISMDCPTFSSDGLKLHILAVDLGRCVLSVDNGHHVVDERPYCELTEDIQLVKHRWRHDPAQGVDISPDQEGAFARPGDLIVVPEALESYNRALILREARLADGLDQGYRLVATCLVFDRTAGLRDKGLETNVRGLTDEVAERLFTII